MSGRLDNYLHLNRLLSWINNSKPPEARIDLGKFVDSLPENMDLPIIEIALSSKPVLYSKLGYFVVTNTPIALTMRNIDVLLADINRRSFKILIEAIYKSFTIEKE